MVSPDIREEFRESLRKIALPVTLQNILFVSLNFVDTLMVGKLGKVPFSAVGLGGQYYFLANLAIVGIVSGMQIYMAQYWGEENVKGYRQVTGLSVISSLVVSLFFALPAFFAAEFILSLFSKDRELIAEGVPYLRIIAFQIPLIAVVLSFASASRASKNAKIPLRVSMVSLCTNTLLNYLLIFGKFGFPKLEVRGAAIATVLSVFLSLCQYFLYILKPENPLHANPKEFLSFGRDLALKVFRTGWPVFLHEVFWSLGMSLYVIIFSRTSTDVYASYQIANQLMRITYISTVGISSAASITIGNQLGAKNIDKAVLFEKAYSKLLLLVSSSVALLMIGIAYFAVNWFNVSQEIRQNAFGMIIVIAFFLPPRMYNAMEAAGILRAGGDTGYPVFLELSGIYLINLPLAFVGLRFLDIPYPAVVALSSLGDICILGLMYRRVKSKVWAKNLISE